MTAEAAVLPASGATTTAALTGVSLQAASRLTAFLTPPPAGRAAGFISSTAELLSSTAELLGCRDGRAICSWEGSDGSFEAEGGIQPSTSSTAEKKRSRAGLDVVFERGSLLPESP